MAATAGSPGAVRYRPNLLIQSPTPEAFQNAVRVPELQRRIRAKDAFATGCFAGAARDDALLGMSAAAPGPSATTAPTAGW